MLYVGVILFLVCLVGTPISILVWIIRAILKKTIRKNATASMLFFIGFVAGIVMILRSPDIDEEPVAVSDTNAVDNYVSQDEGFYDTTETQDDDLVDAGDDYIGDTDDFAEDQDESDIEKSLFDIPEYPYQNKKEAKKLMKTYNKAMEASITDFIGVEEVSEGGIIKEKEIHYKKTVDDGKAAYRYYGKTNKYLI